MKAVKFDKLPKIWLIVVTFSSFLMGYMIGSSVKVDDSNTILPFWNSKDYPHISHNISKIYVATNPHGAERLPPGIIEAQSDFIVHEYGQQASNETQKKPKYLLALTVGIKQKEIVDKIVSKFSENFTIMLFHYDGNTSEWDQFEWSHRAIHVTALKQSKWWFAKRFLHPDIVAPYEYIFIWDEDLGVDHFNAEEYIKIVKKYGLEISQPGVSSKWGMTWELTKKRKNVEIHRKAGENIYECPDPNLPPCAGFVEIMAPVFSKASWNCVRLMIQNDLVHGWGLDFAFWRCVKKPHEKIGVVDAQWVKHMWLPTLKDQEKSLNETKAREDVQERCLAEWREFERRMKEAEKKSLV